MSDQLKKKLTEGRRSSLKTYDNNTQNLINVKGKRHSVSWGKSDTFQFKQMKATFQESKDVENADTPILEEADAVEEEIKQIFTELRGDIPRSEIKQRYRSAIDLERITLLNSIGLYADGIIDSYPPKTMTHEEQLNHLVELLNKGELEVEILREVLVVDKQYAYVMASFIRDLVISVNEFLNTEDVIDRESINELFNEQLTRISDLYNMLKEVVSDIQKSYEDKEEEEEQKEDTKFKIIFVKNGVESYFDKSLMELTQYENIGNIEKILVDLENGNFGNDRKILDYKYKTRGSFVIFYKVKNGHVFIFNVMLARDISSKKTDSILSLMSYDDELKTVVEKNEDYDKLVEDSDREREQFRVMLGVATGAFKY